MLEASLIFLECTPRRKGYVIKRSIHDDIRVLRYTWRLNIISVIDRWHKSLISLRLNECTRCFSFDAQVTLLSKSFICSLKIVAQESRWCLRCVLYLILFDRRILVVLIVLLILLLCTKQRRKSWLTLSLLYLFHFCLVLVWCFQLIVDEVFVRLWMDELELLHTTAVITI